MVEGKQSTLLLLVLFSVTVILYMARARRGKLPSIRRIAGLDAVEEAIGRATELGRSVFYVPGRAEINASGAAQTMASLGILSHVSHCTARYETQIEVAVGAANVYPIADAIVREAYVEEGKSDRVNSETVQFLSSEQYAFAAACLAKMSVNRPASVMLIGEFTAESMMLSEQAASVGAVTIAGTSRTAQIPFFVAAADYTLIGEEMFAGSAYFSRDPIQLATVAGQDIGKLLALVLVFVGSLLVTFGNNLFIDFLKR